MAHNPPNPERFPRYTDPFFVTMRLMVDRYGECLTERSNEVWSKVQAAIERGDDPIAAFEAYEGRGLYARKIW